MAQVRIEINQHVWFDGEIEGFHQPAVLPSTQPMKADALPKDIRVVLAKAMAKTLEERLPGMRVSVEAL